MVPRGIVPSCNDGHLVHVRPLMVKDGKLEVQLYEGDEAVGAVLAYRPPPNFRTAPTSSTANYPKASFEHFPFPLYLVNTAGDLHVVGGGHGA